MPGGDVGDEFELLVDDAEKLWVLAGDGLHVGEDLADVAVNATGGTCDAEATVVEPSPLLRHLLTHLDSA